MAVDKHNKKLRPGDIVGVHGVVETIDSIGNVTLKTDDGTALTVNGNQTSLLKHGTPPPAPETVSAVPPTPTTETF